MAVLASRNHLCIRNDIPPRENVNEFCKSLMYSEGCIPFFGAKKVEGHSSFQAGGSREVFDIEDLVKVGKDVHGCSYFGSRAMAETADIVFCPYNYLLDPGIRKSMSISLKNSVVIIDEGHNTEDVCRSVASKSFSLPELHELILELMNVVKEDFFADIHMFVHNIAESLRDWFAGRAKVMVERDYNTRSNVWQDNELLKVLGKFGLSSETFPEFSEYSGKIMSLAKDDEVPGPKMNSNACFVLEKLQVVFGFIFGRDLANLSNYRMVITKVSKDN
eukprot:1009508_1